MTATAELLANKKAAVPPETEGSPMPSMFAAPLIKKFARLAKQLDDLELGDRVEVLNAVRLLLHKASPFAAEPVDCVLWIKAEEIEANDYNPNAVAPPEMKLLERSISEDGYTQPIVSWLREDERREVVDGFHRNRIGRESETVRARIHGYLPVTTINTDRTDRGDRIAATIRHNRARGKHRVDSMSDIVIELKKRNWTNAKIAKELGMDDDEILRLCQIGGLAEVFGNEEFSEAWDAAQFIDDVPDGDIVLEDSKDDTRG